MTSCRLTILFIPALFGVAYLYVIPSHQPVQPCAASCSCTSEDTEWGSAVNVQCGDRNLRSVPITKHDNPVSLLNASFNVLMTLKEDTLFSYESVRNLYFQHCKIVFINEKAFQRLENLTEIDLSSNRLTSVSPNLFNGNQKLNKLILRNNNLGSLQWNTPILNGPSSLSFLDLQSCQLSNISSTTFSLLLNLTFLDISRNNLVLLNPDNLSSHEKLKDVNLENNPWQCGAMFKELMCWMHSKLALSHNRKVQCQYRNERWDIWALENRSSLCRPITTPSTGELVTVMPADLTTVSVGVPLSPKTSPHTPRVVETAVTADLTTFSADVFLLPKASSNTSRVVETAVTADLTTVSAGVSLLPKASPYTSRVVETAVIADLTTVSVGVPLSPKASPETPRVGGTAVTSEAELGALPESKAGSWASLLPWNVNTLMVFVIQPITLGGAVFVALIAVNYITKKCRVLRPQRHIQGEDNHIASCLDSAVPFLNPQLEADLTNQALGYVNRSSENFRHNECHVYEEIR